LPKAGEKKPNYTEIAMTFGGMIDKLQVNKQYQVKNRLKLGHQSGSKLKFKKVKRNKDNDIELEVEGSLKDIDGVWTISLLDTDDNRLLSNKPIQVKGKGDKLKTKIDGESASTYHDEIKFEVTFQAVKVDNQIQAEKEGSWDSAIFYNSKGSKTVKFGDSSSTGGSSSGSDKGSSGGSDGGSSTGDDKGGDDKGGTSDGDDQGRDDKGGSSTGNDQGGDDKGGTSDGDDQGGDDKGGTSDGDDKGGDDKGGSSAGDDQGGDDKGGTSDGDDQGEDNKDGSSNGTDQSGDDEGGNDDSNDNGDSSEAIPVTIEASHSIDKQGNLVITATLKDVEKAKGNWKITYDQQSEEVEGGQKISYIIEKSKLKNGTTPLTLEFTGLADGKKVSGKLELDVEVQGVEDNETTDDGSGNTNDSNDSTETGNDDTDNDNGNTSNTPTSSNGSTTIGGPLPKTANTYPFLLALGTACMVLGGTVWYYMRRKTQ
jgi:LPXTG-motif cell wall-anchored protein